MIRQNKTVSFIKTVLKNIAVIFDNTVLDFFRHNGVIYAGALAFFAFMALVPLLLVLASVIGYVVYFFSGGNDQAIEHTLSQIAQYGDHLLPHATSLHDELFKIVNNRGKLSFFGFLALLFSASQLFQICEQSLARVFGPREIAALAHKKYALLFSNLFFGVLVVTLAMFFVVFQLLSHVFFDMVKLLGPDFAQKLGGSGLINSSFSLILSFLVSCFIFVAVVKMSTSVKINWSVLFLCGSLFSVLIYLTALGYNLYIDNTFSFISNFYGSLGASYIVVLWLYCLTIIFLICVEFVKILHFGLRRSEKAK